MPRLILLPLAALILGASLQTGATFADAVQLTTGGQLTGKATRRARDGTEYVVVTVDDGEIHLMLPINRVKQVISSDQLREYRARAIAAGNDAEAHYELAKWCNTPGNIGSDRELYRDHHMERAIQLDPEHQQARSALEYRKHNGKWIQRKELERQRGMIWRRGRQELPEAAAIAEQRDALNVSAKQWKVKIGRLVGIILTARNVERVNEARAELSQIQDPLAALAVAEQLEKSRTKVQQPRALRLLWIEMLGRFKNRESIQALTFAGVYENDPIVREAALEQLTRFGSQSAVATYIPMLESNQNAIVNRAAAALSWFPDPELDLVYSEALITEHKTTEAPSAGISSGFDSSGGVGMTQGGKPVVVTRRKQNTEVLRLLKTIAPEVDYGYDEEAWVDYFAHKRTAYNGDLRRDP